MVRTTYAMLATAVLSLSFISPLEGQDLGLPDTMHFPVIFYDYKADGSNPAFEQGCGSSGGVKEMVVDTIANSLFPKPSRNPIVPSDYADRVQCYESVGQWFQPSGTGGPSTAASFYFDKDGDSTWKYSGLVPRPGGTPGEYVALDYSDSYELRNIVIYDSLPFELLNEADGTYIFERRNVDNSTGGFFWIDDRGFGNEPATSGKWTNPGRNYSFSMELHHYFTYKPGLKFDFLGDDDVWVFINDSLVIDLGGQHKSLSATLDLDDLSGWLVEDEKYRFDFFYVERHTYQSNIRITTNILTKSVGGLQITTEDQTLVAGESIDLDAVLITNFGEPLNTSDPAYNDIVWQISGAATDAGDNLNPSEGRTATFSATKAHRDVTITASYTDPNSGLPVSDQAVISIVPAAPHHITIESEDLPLSAHPWEDEHSYDLTQVVLTSDIDVSTDTMFAYIRDQHGNLVDNNPAADANGHALSANWALDADPANASDFSSVNTAGNAWSALVSRVNDSSGTSRIIASQGSLVPDTVTATLLAVEITQIRVIDAVADTVVTNISMNTDQSITLRVQGLPSNSSEWVTVPGTFTPSSGLNIASPGNRPEWVFQPTQPGSGTITVTYTATAGITPYVINATITTAPPSSIDFTLIDQNPVAGQRFRAVVRIYNDDGLVQGTYCYPDNGYAKNRYMDAIPQGTGKPDPMVYPQTNTGTDADAGFVGYRQDASTFNERDSVSQCFYNGIDTVEVILYNTASNSNHRLWVRLNGKDGAILEAATDLFKLRPGPVDSLAIEYVDGGAVPDSLTWTAPDSSFYVAAIGYDAWGNQIGPVPSSWQTSGNLHQPTTDTVTTVYYSTEEVRLEERGCLTVTAKDNSSASDQVCIVITPPAATIQSAYTRDTDGDGYLDRIEVRFNRPTQFPADYSPNNITVKYDWYVGSSVQKINFTPSSVVSANGIPVDSVYYIELNENITSKGQTGWKPDVTIANAPDISSTPITTIDGAGPVIWKVTREVKDVEDRTKDIITIEFSESLDEVPGPGKVPDLTFYVWREVPADSAKTGIVDTVVTSSGTRYYKVDTEILNGIEFFNTPKSQLIAEFTMQNGKTLTDMYLFSIRADSTPVVKDMNNVVPAENNQRVRVTIKKSPVTAVAGPNPTAPNPSFPNPENLEYEDPSVVTNRALNNGGTAFHVTINLPSDPNTDVQGKLRIYDNVGNLVHTRESIDNLIPASWKESWEAGVSEQIGFYWNGFNDKGMAVSPGVYRALIDFTVTSTVDGATSTQQVRRVIPLGIRR